MLPKPKAAVRGGITATESSPVYAAQPPKKGELVKEKQKGGIPIWVYAIVIAAVAVIVGKFLM